jgi:predicted flap endonuclease-1-like 5' DNA nuclease
LIAAGDPFRKYSLQVALVSNLDEDLYAIVKKGRKSRKGRGFSSYEVQAAGLSFSQALARGIPIDLKRSTTYDENVDALQAYRAVEASPPVRPMDLRAVKGVGQKRAEQLKAAGFDSLQKLAESDPQTVAAAAGVSENRAATWIDSAKTILAEQN